MIDAFVCLHILIASIGAHRLNQFVMEAEAAHLPIAEAAITA
jgi:hypothetical protein